MKINPLPTAFNVAANFITVDPFPYTGDKIQFKLASSASLPLGPGKRPYYVVRFPRPGLNPSCLPRRRPPQLPLGSLPETASKETKRKRNGHHGLRRKCRIYAFPPLLHGRSAGVRQQGCTCARARTITLRPRPLPSFQVHPQVEPRN